MWPPVACLCKYVLVLAVCPPTLLYISNSPYVSGLFWRFVPVFVFGAVSGSCALYVIVCITLYLPLLSLYLPSDMYMCICLDVFPAYLPLFFLHAIFVVCVPYVPWCVLCFFVVSVLDCGLYYALSDLSSVHAYLYCFMQWLSVLFAQLAIV